MTAQIYPNYDWVDEQPDPPHLCLHMGMLNMRGKAQCLSFHICILSPADAIIIHRAVPPNGNSRFFILLSAAVTVQLLRNLPGPSHSNSTRQAQHAIKAKNASCHKKSAFPLPSLLVLHSSLTSPSLPLKAY